MEYLEFFSPNSATGISFYIVGFILTVYLNVKVYSFDKDES